MKIIKYLLIFIVVVIVAVTGCIFYAFKIEPYSLEVNEYTMNEKGQGTQALKVVQISDTHIKEDYTVENFAKVVDEVNAQKPDVVVFTGDLYDNYAFYNDDIKLIEQLYRIEATYGKIAIWGNRDYGGGARRSYSSIMQQSGFTVLKNETTTITLDNDKTIRFIGLDDSMLGYPDMNEEDLVSSSNYDVLLSHEPDTVSQFMQYKYPLSLSGHSHGGQINIPLLPSINEKATGTTGLANTYSMGMYTLNDEETSKLYVNTGIGTTHISARFNMVPEIAVFTIHI